MTDYRERAREKAYNAIVGFFSDEWCREYAALRPDLEEYLTSAITSAMEEAAREERERCAGIALNHYLQAAHSGVTSVSPKLFRHIAQAIRNEDVTARPAGGLSLDGEGQP